MRKVSWLARGHRLGKENHVSQRAWGQAQRREQGHPGARAWVGLLQKGILAGNVPSWGEDLGGYSGGLPSRRRKPG